MVMQIRVKQTRDYGYMPRYAHPGDAGLDLCAVGKHRVPPLGTVRIPTGIAVAIPEGYQGEVRPRSGLSSKGIHVILGTIDSGYRGEIEVVLFNSTGDFYNVRWGDRIAQLVIMPVVQANFVEVRELDETERGADGFGSTGMGLDGPAWLEETWPADPVKDVEEW
jgi:dUTP pyrophosphatase